jgi:hypothetical protein
VLEARLSQVGMQIDETRRYDQAGRVEDFRIRRRIEALANRRNDPVLDQNIETLVKTL